jgi:2-methylisocitrate lyase-like PEP mutase family enzyme
LEREFGMTITYVPVNRYGVVDPADVAYFEAPQSVDEIKAFVAEVKGPVMATLVALKPQPAWAELEALGVGVAFYPGHGMMAGNIANWDFLQDFRKRGPLAEAELKARTAGHPLAGFGLFDLVGFPKVREMEERYLPEAREKYARSTGMYTPGQRS